MKIVAKTDRGKVRATNQDAYFVGEFPGEVAWAVVCDGMGGAAGGNIASALAVKVINERISASYNPHMKESSIKNMLESALIAANLEVYDLSIERSELNGMGTTVVCAVVKDGQAYIAYAGDSRAYISSGGKLTQVTVDHSMVQDLVNKGKLTSEEAAVHPNRNIITRALGVQDTIDVDFKQVDFAPGDILILCTDGLSNYVSAEEISEVVKDTKYYAFADRLVKKANTNGGGDNITVVAIAN